MRVEEIKKLIELVERSRIGELEVRKWWGTVRISKTPSVDGHATHVRDGAIAPPIHSLHAAPQTSPAGSASAEPTEPSTDGLVPIVAPIVGTFYRAASPSGPPYVDVGTRITPGQVVCIIEAMKLMNEIEAEAGGTVARILVENGQPVEFNQPLILVKPD
jgi:acetyl-CoA carboxylase biotin carboxyl carrier protein